ncbi:MAG TPA: MFS transporter [Pseudobdellovibrionaceae bacterium]|nr:MFS transporter [Pseudobdellovibrionaceae bacterium]
MSKIHFSKYQIFVVGVLTFLQFTIILDFMVLSPLGALLMPAFHITPTQFGIVVSAYAFSAALSGILAAGYADRFDRKKILLFFYSGFIFSTLLCGIAPNFPMLLLARTLTGIFGGVIGSIVFAITTDLFPLETRGRVMGFVQTAFAGSQVLGLPFSLYLSNRFGWHSPFLFIVIIGTVAGFFVFKYLKPIDSHLKQHLDKHPLHHLLDTVKNRYYLKAFAAVALLSTGGFMIMPFASAFSVNNLGIDINDLPLLYLTTGIISMIVGPFIGRASDAFGKYRVFIVGSIFTMITVSIYTNLGQTTLAHLMIVNAFMFIGISMRMIPSQALVSAVPKPLSRGAFMSVSSSIQSLSGGLASIVAGAIISESADGKIEHFNQIGYIIICTTLVTLFLMYQIHKRIHEKLD